MEEVFLNQFQRHLDSKQFQWLYKAKDGHLANVIFILHQYWLIQTHEFEHNLNSNRMLFQYFQ